MKVVIHTQYFPPEMGAPQARLSELADGLAYHGIEVIVLTSMPNYPTGKIFHGFSGLVRKEINGNIKVIRTIILPNQSIKIIPRMICYFSFVISSLFVGLIYLPQVDFLLTESPPLFLGITGWILSVFKGAKWIFNISDLWPLSAVELGTIKTNSFACLLSQQLEKILYRVSWLVTGQSKTIIKNINYRFPMQRTYLLSNGVNTNVFKNINKHDSTKKIRVIYAGLHGIAQGLNQIIDAAYILKDENIDFIFVGDGPEKAKLIRQKDKLRLKKVIFIDPVRKNEVSVFLSRSDIILIPLKIQITGAVPSKIYEAMACGKPIILLASGEAEKIINTAKCGVVIKPGDIDGLVQAISSLAKKPSLRRKMGNSGCIFVKRNFDRSVIINKFRKKLLYEVTPHHN